MDTKKQRQRRHDDVRLTKSRNAKSEQLLMMSTELLTNREWLLGKLLNGLERRRPGCFLDMKYQTCFGLKAIQSSIPIYSHVLRHLTRKLFLLFVGEGGKRHFHNASTHLNFKAVVMTQQSFNSLTKSRWIKLELGSVYRCGGVDG